MSAEVKNKENLDKIARELMTESNKEDPKIVTTGFGVGFNMQNAKVKEAMLNAIKNSKK